jgi:NADH-quinone oxidoreductase subunit C
MHKELIDNLIPRFDLTGVKQSGDSLLFLGVTKPDAVPLISHLKQMEGFGHLVFFTAVDQLEQGVFELKYMLHSYPRNLDLCVTVSIPRDNAVMDSIHRLWPAAVTYEQELAEMFGIDFPGSPRVGQSFILESWDNMPPMRRDFDTREYSEKTYYARPGRETRDPAEHMRRELYPSEAEQW